jgi:hypothetical protein
MFLIFSTRRISRCGEILGGDGVAFNRRSFSVFVSVDESRKLAQLENC